MRLEDLASQRIAILGAGREGQSAYRWLIDRIPHGEMTVIAESPVHPAFRSSMRAADRVIVEPFTSKRLSGFDLLVRSPGISPYREPFKDAVALGTRITSASSLWFAAHPEAKTICITGTKGKSTTSSLVAHMLRACGFRVELAGNIGRSLLACDGNDVDWWVIELSSYQLVDLEASPGISMILNLSPEHLDWHGGFETYARDKLRLAALAGDKPLILNALDSTLTERLGNHPAATWFNATQGIHVSGMEIKNGKERLPVRVPAGMPGLHNLQNVAAALTALAVAGCPLDRAARAVESFEPLPHRLQLLGETGGVTYINDSIATTPVSTLAALESMKGRPIILLVGGLDRGLDWTKAAEAFARFPPKAVIGMPGNGPKILAALTRAGFKPAKGLHEVPDLEQAVKLSRELSEGGEAVVLSPGAPSFPQFADYRERGHAFARFCGFAPQIDQNQD